MVLNIKHLDDTNISGDDIKTIMTDALSIERYSNEDGYMEILEQMLVSDGMKFSVVDNISCKTHCADDKATTTITNLIDDSMVFNAILLFGLNHLYTIYVFDELEIIKPNEPYLVTAHVKDDELSSNVTIAIMEADDKFNDIKESLLLIGTASSYHTFLDRLNSILNEYKYEILETRSFKEFKATNGVNTVFELTNGKMENEKQSDYNEVMLKCCHNIDIGFKSGVLPNNIRTQLVMIAPIKKASEEEKR